jgi:hypothetical protein
MGMSLSTAYLKELVDYDNGNLIWRVNKYRSKKGTIAGSKDNKGYMQLKLDQKVYRLHRLIWLWHGKELPEQLDHIDRNPLNNRIENLRAATPSKNQWNTSKADNGVSFHKASNKWRARIKINNQEIHLGVFKNLEDAKSVRDEAARRRWGCR